MVRSVRFPLIFLATALVSAGSAGTADRLERPRVSYKADIRIDAGTIILNGTTYYTPRKERRELRFRGSKSAAKPVIIRRDKGRLIVLDTANRTYVERRLSQNVTGLPEPMSKKIIGKVRLGNETKNGVDANKYKVTFAGDVTGQLAGLVWISRDDILLAVDGHVTVRGQARPFKMSLGNLQIGPQPDGLFEIPKGYKLGSPTRPRRKSRTPHHR